MSTTRKHWEIFSGAVRGKVNYKGNFVPLKEGCYGEIQKCSASNKATMPKRILSGYVCTHKQQSDFLQLQMPLSKNSRNVSR